MPWCASSPHHVTAVFLPFYATSLLGSGSIGVGLAVGPRFRACIPGPERPPTTTASRALRIAQSRDESGFFFVPLPPAKGYAVSAASAVASALASVRVDGMKVGYFEALRAAHKAEVLERTGLGDVLAISCGVGVVFRRVPGGPGLGSVECVPVPRSVAVLALEASGFMRTGELLGLGYIRRFRGEAASILRWLFDSMSFEAFVEGAMRYTVLAGLDKRVLGESGAAVVRRLPGLIGYYSKKLVTIVMVEGDRVEDAREALAGLRGVTLRVLEVSESGPEVWWDYGW